VEDGRGLLLSFFDRRAELRTVERIDEVENHARKQVQVTDPQQRLAGDRIFVADLSKPAPGGGYRYWIEARGAWLMRLMPKVTMLAHLAVDDPTPDAPRAPARRRRAPRRRPRATGGAAQVAAPRVVLYSTAWCPSCRTAKAFFQSKGVPFVEKDVEQDQQAAAEYSAVCQRAGLRRGAVPVIVVNGQAFQGFNAQQMESALARTS
jgi:glutaredoxin